MRRLPIAQMILLIVLLSSPAISSDRTLTIIHTNDMHSHLLGAPPNIEYTPEITADDHTIGGWARIATVIRDIKGTRQNPVLVLDAGDFLMGSLFHMLSREQAFELRLLHMMGYDMVTLGNHEFDLKPQGLARILTAAQAHQQLPPIVFSNVVFSYESSEDDELERLFKQGLVQPYRILEKNNVRTGWKLIRYLDSISDY